MNGSSCVRNEYQSPDLLIKRYHWIALLIFRILWKHPDITISGLNAKCYHDSTQLIKAYPGIPMILLAYCFVTLLITVSSKHCKNITLIFKRYPSITLLIRGNDTVPDEVDICWTYITL